MIPPLNINALKLKEVYAFLLMWTSGTPNVKVEINEKTVTFITHDNPDLVFIFLAGWVKNSLET